MKRLLMVGGTLAALILIGTTVLGAQHQMGSRMQMGGQQEQPFGQPSMGRGMMGRPMMMCQMMPHMMGGHMDPLGIGVENETCKIPDGTSKRAVTRQ